MPFGAFFIKNNFLIFFCGRCGGSNSISHSYIKAPFDSDKVYQLISDIVDKTFITDDEEDPYVSKSSDEFGFRQKAKAKRLVVDNLISPFFVMYYLNRIFPLCLLQVYNANENVNLCQGISKEIRDTLKTWRQLTR